MPALLILVYLAVVVLTIASLWKVFVKAGKPGWAAIVPFYNTYVMTEIGGLEIIWFILLFVPIANIVAGFKIMFAVAEKFGKTVGFGVGMVFLPFIFFPILGFGDAKYAGGAPAAAAAPPVQPPQQPPAAPQA